MNNNIIMMTHFLENMNIPHLRMMTVKYEYSPAMITVKYEFSPAILVHECSTYTMPTRDASQRISIIANYTLFPI